MAVAFDLTQAVMDEAERRGVPITPEQAAAEAARASLGRTPPAESRTDGAPEVDLSDLTPQSYYDSMDRRGRQLENGGPSNPLPGQPGWTEDSEILAYEPGMTDAEYAAAKANRMHRERMLRGMGPDPGGYTAFNPQQPMWLGTADDQAQWSQYLANNPEAQRRYDPASYAANRAAEEQAAANAHAARLEERYGPDSAAAYLESQRTGKPMDMNMVRTPQEREAIADRREFEIAAREGDTIARQTLRHQDQRSGYRGALANTTMDPGQSEERGARFARRTQERKAQLDARRRRATLDDMLAGPNAGQNLTNAFDLIGDQGEFGLTPNQQRALQYMMPGANLLAEVEARNLENAAGMATSALQRSLGPLVTAAAGGAGGNSQLGVGDMAYEQVQQGNLTHPSVIEYARQYHGTLWSFPGRDKVQKTVDYLLLTLPGMDEPTARRIAESF